MKPILDIVGHFGTTFSYATVASNIARVLRNQNALGAVINLDPEWHPEHEHLRGNDKRGTHVFLVSVPHHYMDTFPKSYGRDRSAVFMSPNTDALGAEYAETCSMFGLAVAPSDWCAAVTGAALFKMNSDTIVVWQSLGVSDQLLERRKENLARLRQNMDPHRQPMPMRILHLSSDQSWPGRKGTEELLRAWAKLRSDSYAQCELHVHVPPALVEPTLRLVRSLDIDQSVEVIFGSLKGDGRRVGIDGDNNELVDLICGVDLVVAPSRCEGFGIMLLSAIVAGTPLLCTYETGQRDFLSKLPGWMGVPTDGLDRMAGEAGMAPVVNPDLLCRHLRIAMQPQVRDELLMGSYAADVDWESHTWRGASRGLGDLLIGWMERDN